MHFIAVVIADLRRSREKAISFQRSAVSRNISGTRYRPEVFVYG